MNVIQKKVKRKTMSLYFFVWENIELTPKTYDQLNLNEAKANHLTKSHYFLLKII